MSLLLDALKEAGAHRKTAVQKPDEQAPSYEGELELELELDVGEINDAVLELRVGGIDTDAEIKTQEKSVVSSDDGNKDKSLEPELNAPIVEAAQYSKEQVKSSVREDLQDDAGTVDEPQVNQVANAVFRNRTRSKSESSKYVFIIGFLLLITGFVVAYLYWSLTSVTSFEEGIYVSKNITRAGLDTPLLADNIKAIADNSGNNNQSIDQHNSQVVNRTNHAGQSVPGEDTLENQLDSHYSEKDSGQQDNVVVNELLSPPQIGKSVDEISISKRKIPNKTRRNIVQAKQAMAAGEWSVAQDKYRSALVNSPENVEALIGMADVMSVLGSNDIAMSHYLKALERSPGDLNASVGLLNLKDDKKALSHGSELKQLMAENPDQAFIHANLGDYYVGRSEWLAAQTEYFDAFALQPKNANYAYNLAVCLDQLGKGKIAVRYYKQALALKVNRASRFEEKSVLKRIEELTGGGK